MPQQAVRTRTVSSTAWRGSASRRSGGTLTRIALMPVTRLSGTGSTCISASGAAPPGLGRRSAPDQAPTQGI